MYNTRMEILKNFKKPDKDFLKDKECLICLESIDPTKSWMLASQLDMEPNKLVKIEDLVKLPCGCANSAYHIGCVLLLLNSGQNKNFCPHCKTFYQVNPPPITRRAEIENALIQTRKFAHILMFHLLSNSIMNCINIIALMNHSEYNIKIELKALMPFYLCKLVFNYGILSYSKNNLDKIETGLFCSYSFQTILFGLLIYALSKVKNNYCSGILISNNILCVVVDIGFRIYMERRFTAA